MPNPKANQQPLDLDRIKADAMSMGIPARVLLDMIASGARSAVATTAGLPVDTLNTAIGLHNMAHDIRRRKFEGYEPGTIPGGSEDIKGLIPNPVKDPNSNLNKMADFGGDFAIIPGVGTAAMKGAKMVGQEIADRVATGQKLMPGSFSEPQMAMHVVKPKGGNWLTGDVEKQLGRMKMADLTTPEEMAEMQKSIDTAKRIMGDDPTVQRTVNQMENELSTAKRNNSINNWIDSNLTNYVKKQMGTPEDPVRKLAEENVLHMKPYGDQQSVSSRLMSKRMGAGFDPLGAGKSDAARFWERQADTSIDPYPAGSYKHGALDEKLLEANPWLQNVPDDQMVNYAKGLNDLGFDHIIDVLRQDVREGRIRPEQLNKVSMEQAVRRTYEYDQEMAKKMAEAQFKITEGMPVHKEYPEGYKWIELKMPEAKLPEGHSIVQDYPTKSNWSVVPHPEGSGYGIRADNGQFGSDASSNNIYS